MDCLHCRVAIADADINVGADTALCRSCGRLSRPSDALKDQGIDLGLDLADADVDHPPRGCSFVDDGLDRTWEAKLRNLSLGGFFLLFSTFWCSVTSIFATLIASATLRHLGVSVPWLPQNQPDAGLPFGDSAGGLVLAWLFITPFLLVGIATACLALVNLFGRVSVRVRQSEGSVRSGLGPLARNRRFDATAVRRVGLGVSNTRVNGQPLPILELEHGKAGAKIRFGTGLPQARMAWMAAALRQDLMGPEDRGLRFAR